MNLSRGLLIKDLILPGHRKEYRVQFQPGVNIIYGDVDTGKSTILRFIYYLLGGKAIKIDEEVAASVKYAALDIAINGDNYCIVRDIFDPSRDIEVYHCPYSDIANTFPEKYKSSVSKAGTDNDSLSDFLLDILELPAVRLKRAPTKDQSETAKLSFLDLFKYMYLDQDDVGSTKMLDAGNYVIETRNKEVLKYIFNVLDSSIAELEVDISNRAKEQESLTKEYSAISRFLSKTELKTSEELDEEISGIDALKSDLSGRLSDLNKRMVGDHDLYDSLKDALDSIKLAIDEQEGKKSHALQNIDRFSRLYNDYKNDVEKIDASLSAKDVIGSDLEERTNCPICESVISISDISGRFDIPSDVKLDEERKSIIRRLKDISSLIADNRQEVELASIRLDDLRSEQRKARAVMDGELEESVSPYLAERDAIVKELAQLDERRETAVHSLRVRNKLASIVEEIERLESGIEKLHVKLEELKSDAPSLESTVKDIGSDVDEFLRRVKLKNHYGVGLDEKTLLPTVRDIEYRKINSGGLRTIVSIGYLASILRQKLSRDTNIPGLLMIDTVGKFLGKTPEPSEDSVIGDAEGVEDPEKYRNLFDALIRLAEDFEEQNMLCQIILVDNDIPHDVAYDTKGFEVAHYRSSGVNGLPVGLIDDWASSSGG